MRAKPDRPFPALILGLGALCAAVLTVTCIVWVNLDRLETVVARDGETRETLLQTDAVLEAIIDQETGVRGYVLSGEPVFLQPYAAGRSHLRSALDRLSALTSDNAAQHARVVELVAMTETWRASIAQREIDLVRSGDLTDAQVIVKAKGGVRQMTAIRQAIGDVRAFEDRELVQREAASRQAFATARWMLALGSIAGLALAGLLGGRALWLLLASRRAAQEATAFLDAIIELMPVTLIVKSAEDGVFRVVNRAGQEMLGFSRDELVGRSVHDLFPAEQAELFAASDREALATPDGLTIDEEAITTRHGLRFLTTRKIGIRTADGRGHLIVVATDITRMRDATAALQLALDRAQSADRAKTQFLANMSHEIRTPLNGVAGIADALARSGLRGDQRELVDTISRSASAVDTMLGDLLSLSRSAEAALERATFNLGDALRENVGAHQARAQWQGLELMHDIGTDADVEVEGDLGRLGQILGCLLSNALKFTDRGRVELRAHGAGGQRYRIEVQDTGIGFDAAHKQALFEDFAQGDGSLTRRHGGAGLGLAIARQAAAVLGARIDCTSTPGQGSTFILELDLPRAGAAQSPDIQTSPTPQDETPASTEDDGSLRVLIVDDHPTNRRVLELILDQLGVEWVSAADGEQAVRAYGEQPFSAVLMDIQMPVMDGITATREIRRLEREREQRCVPIIIVSANCEAEHVEAGRDAGAQRHLAKPVSAQALIDALNEVLSDEQQAA